MKKGSSSRLRQKRVVSGVVRLEVGEGRGGDGVGVRGCMGREEGIINVPNASPV